MNDIDFQTGVLRRLDKIELREAKTAESLNTLTTSEAVSVIKYNSLDGRLSGIEDSLRWVLRLVIGGLIMGAVAFVLSGGLAV